MERHFLGQYGNRFVAEDEAKLARKQGYQKVEIQKIGDSFVVYGYI